MSELYVMKVPVVSTAHLKKETYDAVHFDVACRARCGYLMPGDSTLFLYVDEIDEVYEGDPADLAELFRWARREGFDWIRLDGGIGTEIEGVPTYKETWA